MKISENFSLKEFSRSQTATRLGIDNTVPLIYIPNIIALTENVLQPARNEKGRIRISSGFRCDTLNALIGGSTRSQHRTGCAADFEAIRCDNLETAHWIADNCEFDQLILEFYEHGDALSGWVHCSYNLEGNRKEILTSYKLDGRTQYTAGLPERRTPYDDRTSN